MSELTIPMAFSWGTRRTLPEQRRQASADLDGELERRLLCGLDDVPERAHRVLVARQAPYLIDLLGRSPALAEGHEPAGGALISQEAGTGIRIVEDEAVATLLPAPRELV